MACPASVQVEDEAPEVREDASNNPWAWRPNSHVRLWTQRSARPVPETGAVVLMEDLLPAWPGGESAHVPAGAGDCQETSWDPASPQCLRMKPEGIRQGQLSQFQCA